MYERILVALDGTPWSNMAMNAAVSLAKSFNNIILVGCHVYGAQMHRTRFEQMEPGLPDRYQEEKELTRLRGAHEDLITDGMQIISDAYLEPLYTLSEKEGIQFKGATPEGRNYVEILNVSKRENIDLVILGAQGYGNVPEAALGSTAERILTHSLHNDVLLMKTPWNPSKHPILVGVDGSQSSYNALIRAATLAAKTGSSVKAVAVFDPFLHSGVFTNIAGVLPPEKQEKFNFTAQEKLHDEIIDDGLEHLYRENLKQGMQLVSELGVEVEYEVLSGKAYPQLHRHAALISAGLIVVGRWGIHQEPPTLIGSNTHNLARICATNLLVVPPPEQEIPLPQEAKPHMEWTVGALKILERIPSFARTMAKAAIEKRASEAGHEIVDENLVNYVAEKMGMNKESK
jgi:nucleotide-binding universal stress UspA family protein